MIAKEEAITKALNYAASRLGVSGNSSVAEADSQTGDWNVAIAGEQEEDLLLVPVKLIVQVYKDLNGEAKCRLAMAPIKSEDVEEKIIEKDFFPTTLPPKKAEQKASEETFLDSNLPY